MLFCCLASISTPHEPVLAEDVPSFLTVLKNELVDVLVMHSGGRSDETVAGPSHSAAQCTRSKPVLRSTAVQGGQ